MIRWIPRSEMVWWKKSLILLGFLVMSFFLSSLIFLFVKSSPLLALQKIFMGSFGSIYGIKETITKAIPLILIGTGLAVAFKAKCWNIGAEGQLLLGAVGATWIALRLSPMIPGYLVLPGMLFAGFLLGSLWGLIPALLKTQLGINETIVTLMLNYIAAEIVQYLVYGPWKGKTQWGFPYTDRFPAAASLSYIPGTRIHWLTLILAISLSLLSWFILSKTRWGFETRVAGENPSAAKYAGISLTRTLILVMIWSGGLAGIAGVGEVAGIHRYLTYPWSISSGYGFTAIIVAWLAKLNPLYVVFSAFFFSGILVGGDAIQTSMGLPFATVNIFNGMLLLSLLAGSYFSEYQPVFSRQKKETTQWIG